MSRFSNPPAQPSSRSSQKNHGESIFLLDFPEALAQWKNEDLLARFDALLEVRSISQKEIELLRAQKIVGSSLEVKVVITAGKELFNQLKSFDGLREFLIVSRVEVKEGAAAAATVFAEKAPGDKCVRCWTYSTEIDQAQSRGHNGICPKCVDALN